MLERPRSNSSSAQLVAFLLLLIVSFPFLGFPGVSFDTQPWAYLLSLALITFAALGGSLRAPSKLLRLLLIAVAVLVSKWIFDFLIIPEGYGLDYATFFRQVFSYTSVFIIFLAVYNYGRLPSRRAFQLIFFIWIFSGVIQLIVPDIFSAVLPRVSTSDARGVTGLASEPTHYARQLALLLILAVYLFYRSIISRRDLLVLTMFVVLNVLFVARSFTGIAFVLPIVITIAWFLYPKLRALLVPSTVILCLVFMYLAFRFMPDSRLVQLSLLLYQNAESLSDFGAYRRLTNVLTSLYVGFIQYSGLGLGFGRELVHVPPHYVPSSFSTLSVNPHGGVIGIVFLAGVFGLPWVWFWLHLLFQPAKYSTGSGRSKSVLLVLALCLLVLCFFEGTTAQPFLVYVVSTIYREEYLSRQRESARQPIFISTVVDT